ncbi:UNVERIFIED_CONTAM: hypothetical protein Sindi_0751000 [Sesamum indicum]
MITDDHKGNTSRTEHNVVPILETNQAREVSDTASTNSRTRKEPVISRTEVENVGKQIERLRQQIYDLKKRGELVTGNRYSPFTNKILTEVVSSSFRLPDLPKYDGLKDPQEHVSAFELTVVQKFAFHFASKRKAKRSTTNLFTIRQKSDEFLKNFIGRFNNETFEVYDLRINMITSILIHGLKKRPFALALARDPPADV